MRYEVKKGTADEIILNPIQMNFLKKKFRKGSRRKITPQMALRLVTRQGRFIGRKSDGIPGWLL